MDAISKLIFNTLAKHEGVNLPGIGSLRTVMHPAAIDKNGILSPRLYRAEYSADQQPELRSVIDLIEETVEVDTAAAEKFYNKWKETVQNAERTTIVSVGTIRNGRYTMAPELKRVLNPLGTDTVQLKQKVSASHVVIWITAAILLGAIASIGSIILFDHSSMVSLRPYTEGHTSLVSPGKEPTRQKSAGAGIQAGSSRENPAADTPGSAKAEAAPRPSAADKAAAPAPAGVNPAASASETAASGSANSSANSTAPAGSEASPAAGEVRYHVIAGVYSTDENAERFIAKSKAQHPGINYTKLPWGSGKIIVSIYSTSSKEDAQQALTRLSAVEKGVWVYTQKGR